MKPRPAARSRQRGVVALVLVAILLLGGAVFAFSSFSFTTVRVDRDRNTNEALAKAKDALIAYAVADTVRPGELPCPDVNNDGRVTVGEDMVGSACVSLLGRLPWFTLGLPDLRDDAGERLWYALSNDFHANGTVPLNSDTAYLAANVSLTMTGTTSEPITNLVAIVFSPGAALTRSNGVVQVVQTRGCAGGAGAGCDVNLKCTSTPAANTDKCNALNYLDFALGEDNADLANRIFVSAPRSQAFNDRLMPVFSDDIMKLVERRASRELAQRMRNHYTAWQSAAVSNTRGFYPFAVPWNDPSNTPPTPGINNTTAGLLPLTNTPLVWSSASSLLVTCIGVGTPTLDCTGWVVCVVICLSGISARIDNMATRFVDPPTAANVQTLLGLSLGGTSTWNLNTAARRLEFSYGNLVGIDWLHIRVSAPSLTMPSWLSENNWQQNAYYAFSPGYSIDGGGGCPPACFTVTNTGSPNNDNQAVVVMSGRALQAAAQAVRPVPPAPPPPVSFNQFFEGVNAGVGTVFESNARIATFNDTAVGVKP